MPFIGCVWYISPTGSTGLRRSSSCHWARADRCSRTKKPARHLGLGFQLLERTSERISTKYIYHVPGIFELLEPQLSTISMSTSKIITYDVQHFHHRLFKNQQNPVDHQWHHNLARRHTARACTSWPWRTVPRSTRAKKNTRKIGEVPLCSRVVVKSYSYKPQLIGDSLLHHACVITLFHHSSCSVLAVSPSAEAKHHHKANVWSPSLDG